MRYPGLLKKLDAECQFLADRIAHEVITDAAASKQPRNWVLWWRGWRYQQLVARAQGKKLAYKSNCEETSAIERGAGRLRDGEGGIRIAG